MFCYPPKHIYILIKQKNSPGCFNIAQISNSIPVTVDGPLEELHGILRFSELPVGGADLSAHPADAGVALEGVGPPLWFLIHHLQNVSSTPLRCGQLLKHTKGSGGIQNWDQLSVQF